MEDDHFRNLDFDPKNIPLRHLQTIGLACAAYAQTEDHLQMAIAGCLGVDAELGWAVTSHMTAPLREDVLKSVAEIKLDDLDDLDRLDELISVIKQAADKRNNITHNLWCIDAHTREVFVVKTSARGTVRADVIPMPLPKLREDADFIYQAGIELFRFLSAKNLLPALPPSDRPALPQDQGCAKEAR
ncbi:conserved hypothetical protein [Mesorhizobium metallidurans STM 2683]|uniref:Uncharacterized protein n=1 Tax=Mesorhizobium metallidurans STM 2683 TaxID=1297569 RepID=M5EIX9_9HYPH|nr:hypothetical protein [Mesorhizobium metallidurans]CCV04322.1 conserved hypothetical protein [Mesorhizobium metallidurans STM 2683]